MIRLITFDLDNTLWHTDPVIRRAEREGMAWLHEHAPEIRQRFTDEQIRRKRVALLETEPELVHYISRWRIRSLELLLEECGYAQPAAAALAQECFTVFQQHREDLDLFEGVKPALAKLAQTCSLIALTNGNANVYNTEAGEYFAHAIRAEEIGAAKPAPDMFHAALEHAGCSAAEAVHIGDDFKNDYRPAAGVGMHAVQAALLEEDRWPAEPPAPCFRHWDELPALIARLGGR